MWECKPFNETCHTLYTRSVIPTGKHFNAVSLYQFSSGIVCLNSRFPSLLAAGDVLRGGMSATQ